MSEDSSKKTKIDPRHTARALAVQFLFNDFVNQANPNLEGGQFSMEELVEIYEQDECDKDKYESLILGVKERYKDIDEVIKVLAPLWPIEQIALIDLVILRIGIWESFISNQVPEKVGIDEAIELAKEFSGKSSAKFINGVLGNLLKNDELKKQLQN